MLDLFRQLKLEYSDYVILFKSGNFYISFDEDAVVMKNIFDYKFVELKNSIKVGFPLGSFDKNINKLCILNVNCLFIENRTIIDELAFVHNKYYDYYNSVYNLISSNNRINGICCMLKELDDKKKEVIITRIEEMLEKESI